MKWRWTIQDKTVFRQSKVKRLFSETFSPCFDELLSVLSSTHSDGVWRGWSWYGWEVLMSNLWWSKMSYFWTKKHLEKISKVTMNMKLSKYFSMRLFSLQRNIFLIRYRVETRVSSRVSDYKSAEFNEENLLFQEQFVSLINIHTSS